ncbi:TcaA second domain-containing protein [Peribacillus loiseleuriae]|uniref:TcaA second domain-containing protein n=1 Tax=Peribacillus loiseleuriae TaxID=1679170 RepID=UPI0038287811
MSKKRLYVISAAFVLIIVIMAAVLFAQQSNKPKQAVEAFEQAVEQKKPNQLKGWIMADDKKAVINDSSLKALVAYLNANNNSYQAITESLDKQVEKKEFKTTNQQISLVETGKKWGLFSEYKFKVKTAYIKVTGQHKDDEIHLSIQKSSESLKKDKEEKLYGPILPGTYQIDLTVKNKLGTFLDKRKVDVWGGSKQVSLIIDDDKLAQSDQRVQEEIISAVETFNKDIVVYQTNGFEAKHLTNVTDSILEDLAFVDFESGFDELEEYVDEIQMQYLETVVNLDDLDINQIHSEWIADVEAFVAYNNKLKIRDLDGYKDMSYKEIRTYSLKYDDKRKRWLIDDANQIPADGSEKDKWDKKAELSGKNSPVMKWKRKGNVNQL